MGQRTYSDVQEDGTLLAWEVERLWELTKDYPRRYVPLSAMSWTECTGSQKPGCLAWRQLRSCSLM